MFHVALHGWPTCTGQEIPEPLAPGPLAHGPVPELAAEPELTPGLAAELGAVVAVVSEDSPPCVAQPVVTTSNAAEAATHPFFI